MGSSVDRRRREVGDEVRDRNEGGGEEGVGTSFEET